MMCWQQQKLCRTTFLCRQLKEVMERAVNDLHGKKTSVYRMENEDWIHGKRGILLTFTRVLRTENDIFCALK